MWVNILRAIHLCLCWLCQDYILSKFEFLVLYPLDHSNFLKRCLIFLVIFWSKALKFKQKTCFLKLLFIERTQNAIQVELFAESYTKIGLFKINVCDNKKREPLNNYILNDLIFSSFPPTLDTFFCVGINRLIFSKSFRLESSFFPVHPKWQMMVAFVQISFSSKSSTKFLHCE